MTFDPYQGVRTNFTKVTHRKPYPTIDVTRPELSQTGKTLLITGGATNIGLLIVKKFIEAGVAKVIIVARRQNVLDDAAAQLREQYGDKTAVFTKQCDQTDREAVSKLWLGLRDEGLEVDILVLNAATFSYAKPLLELGADEMRNAIETNVLGPIDLIEGFNAQPGDSRRVRGPRIYYGNEMSLRLCAGHSKC
jgi:NAD(P)-dependent dehydrogenase (short-subunit alcohol dehydrogenase family)